MNVCREHRYTGDVSDESPSQVAIGPESEAPEELVAFFRQGNGGLFELHFLLRRKNPARHVIAVGHPLPHVLTTAEGLPRLIAGELAQWVGPELMIRMQDRTPSQSDSGAEEQLAIEKTIETVEANFDRLVASMMPGPESLRITPKAIIEAARRRAQLRTQLLSTGAFTYADLALGRGQKPTAVRQWVRRARARRELFTVENREETFVPALLLDEDLSPRPEFQPVIEVLTEAGEDGWGLWAWLAFPSPWLGGAVPAEVLHSEPQRVAAAARARASNAA